MKKILHISTVVLALIMTHNMSFTQTTVANGNWSDPATWGGMPPITSGTVIINHAVILDMDYSHNSGSITINAGGSLNGVSPMRGFALNYPSGTATLSVSGTFNVGRTLLNSSTITNLGTFKADSLLNFATFTNTASATINATEFMNNTGGTITNMGTIISSNFLNLESVTNSGSLHSNDFRNTKSFSNSATGVMTIDHNFLNTDTLSLNAVFTNDGSVSVGNDWQNGMSPATIQGSGSFCIQNNTWNRGLMNGTFDFCDLTGGNLDLNTGTIASGITYCTFPCALGIDEPLEHINFSIYPNPFSTQTTLQVDYSLNNATVTIVNCYGQVVKQLTAIEGNTITLSRDNITNGIYFIRLTEENKTIATERLIIID